MAHPLHHAESSVRKFGGTIEDYIDIHNWFDATKEVFADFRHRAIRHHSQGVFECERLFGLSITNGDGKEVPVRLIGEQHVREDCGGRVPSVEDWLHSIKVEPWMSKVRLEGIDNPLTAEEISAVEEALAPKPEILVPLPHEVEADFEKYGLVEDKIIAELNGVEMELPADPPEVTMGDVLESIKKIQDAEDFFGRTSD